MSYHHARMKLNLRTDALDGTIVSEFFDWRQRQPGRLVALLNKVANKLRLPYRILRPTFTGNHTNVERRVNIFHLLTSVLWQGIPGDVVELGCNKGHTSVLLQRILQHYDPSRTLHLYDSFEGLPQPGQEDGATPYEGGTMKVAPAVIRESFERYHLPLPTIHPGWFDVTLASELPGRIAFAYLDGDFFSSIRVSLQEVYPRLSAGAICVVDDYCDPARCDWNFLPGVKRACDEFFADKPERVVSLHAGYAAQGYFRKL